MTAAPPGPGTANEMGGTVGGHAVQARSIHGDVYIGAHPGPGTPRPRQLPLPPAHFTDRAGPVAVITRAAAQGGPGCAIIVVSGPGGAGKTAVAVHALHQVAGRYAGQLHAPLGAFGASGPARPEAVLAGWLRALGTHPSAVPRDPGEATALFRSLTAGAPVAVLADDAASEAQVRALLPAAGLVVVTSRYQLPGLAAADGARLVPIGPLDPAAATELAARITGRDSEAADLAVLAGYCGHLPLAVRAAAARLAARPALAATAVVADLAAARSRLSALDTPALEISVTASLDASYRALDADTARAYRLLATSPGPDVTVPAAAALLDADEPAAEQLAVALAAASLLEETAPGRWRYHDLVREHAASLAAQHDTAAERNAATARVIDYYLRGSAAADLLVLPGRLRIAAAFGLPILNPPAFATTAARWPGATPSRPGCWKPRRQPPPWAFTRQPGSSVTPCTAGAATGTTTPPGRRSANRLSPPHGPAGTPAPRCSAPSGWCPATSPAATSPPRPRSPSRPSRPRGPTGTGPGKAAPASTRGSAPWHRAATRTPSPTSPARWTAGGASPATGAPRRSSTASSAAPCPTSAGPARPTST